MLAAVLVWAYAHRVTSSRRIEGLCRTDVAFRVICAGNLPDHVTFARFRKDFGGAVGEFFAQVLVLCARLGMGRRGHGGAGRDEDRRVGVEGGEPDGGGAAEAGGGGGGRARGR